SAADAFLPSGSVMLQSGRLPKSLDSWEDSRAKAVMAASTSFIIKSPDSPDHQYGSDTKRANRFRIFRNYDRRVSSTCSGCLAASATFFQCFFTVPSVPTQTLERMMPIFFTPYIIFSPYAPHSFMTFLS